MAGFLPIPRRQILLALGSIPIPTQQSARTQPTEGRSITLPMRFQGGSYVVDWQLDEAQFTGVVDTGSPFMTVSGSCGEIDELWGCLGASDSARKEKRVFPPTYEIFGLQEDGLTDWLSGEVVLNGVEGDHLHIPSMTYGASAGYREREGSAPGASAPMFGLVRDVAEGIRPSFLSQIPDVSAFTIDFESSMLTLMLRGSSNQTPNEREGASVLPLVDLRPFGAPAYEYACKVERLVVNGYDVNVGKPIYCVFDSGTTGMLVSRQLWEKSLLSLGVAQCAMEIQTVDDQRLVVAASTRSCRRDCLLVAR
jgi:hypothetical protein